MDVIGANKKEALELSGLVAICNCEQSHQSDSRVRSRENSKRASREAETVTHFRPSDNDKRAFRRYLVEIGHHLDLIVTVLKDIGLRVHLVGGISIHRLVTGGGDPALLIKKLDGL